MRLQSSPAKFLCAVWLLLPMHSRAQTVVKLNMTDRGFLIVPVSVNGSGPYPFLLDTGSSRTLVQNELLSALGISSDQEVPAYMTTGVSYVRQAVAKSISIDRLSINDIEIEGIEAHQLSRIEASIQGIVGEDFLKHFDILIDNHAKILMLDAASALARSLTGDHVPLSFFGRHGKLLAVDRLIIDLKLPSTQKVHFLIDSGTNSAIFFPPYPPINDGLDAPGVTLASPSGNSRCRLQLQTLRIGNNSFPGVRLAFCQGLTRDKMDVDGTLPTNIFDCIFISHLAKYVIVNPHLQDSTLDRSKNLPSNY